MSRRTRRQRDSPMSLFSFQDIMVAITGVVMLLTLLLIIELILRPPVTAQAAPAPRIDPSVLQARLEAARRQLLESPAPPAEDAATTAASIAASEQLLAILQQQQAAQAARLSELSAAVERQQQIVEIQQSQASQLRRQTEITRTRTRVTRLEGDRAGKTTWFVETAAEDVRVGRIDDEGVTRLAHRFDSAAAAAAWAQRQPRQQERFVLLVRPGGVDAFDELQRALRVAGYDVGWDLWPEPTRLFVDPAATEARDAPTP